MLDNEFYLVSKIDNKYSVIEIWQTHWHQWFAWYPVKIGERYTWLKKVHRKLIVKSTCMRVTYYRDYRHLIQAK